MDIGNPALAAQLGMSLVPGFLDNDIARARLQGLQAQTRAIDLETLAGGMQLDEDSQYQRDLLRYLGNPTPEGNAALLMRYPKKAAALKDAWNIRDKAARTSDLTQVGSIRSLAAAGKLDRAAEILRRRIAADKSAGQDTEDDENILSLLQSPNPADHTAAIGLLDHFTAALTGEDHYGSVLKTFDDTASPKLRSVAPGEVVIDERTGETRFSSPYKPQLITTTDPVTGVTTTLEYTPGQEGGDPSGPGRGGTPALRTNPGAIKDGEWARSQPGYAGSQGGFAVFKNENAGTMAGVKLLQSYISKGFDTPRKIIERWAPPGPENSRASVDNYISHVSRVLGIGPDDKVPPQMAARLLNEGIRPFENGTWQKGGGLRVIAQSGPKPKAPSETRVYQGRTFYKVNGRWFDNPEGI